MTDAFTLTAAAKINLTLHITGRRDDGYHILDSLIGFTGVTDELSFAPANTLTFRMTGPEAGTIETDDQNLVVKAARLAQTHTGVTQGALITLNKNIPAAAGLGGGSADAATTVEGCLKLWNQSSPKTLSDAVLASDLGADVPVCRFGQPAHVGGIGERIAAATGWPLCWVVLVNPRVPLSTADVFKAYDGRFRESDAPPFAGGSFSDFADYLNDQGNDLTEAACKAAPVVKDVLQDLSTLEGCGLSRMSGSGPTCFALFESESRAATAAQTLTQRRPEWWIRATPLHPA